MSHRFLSVRITVVAITIATVGCSSKPKTQTLVPTEHSIKDTSALWQLAPVGTAMATVVADGALADLQRAVTVVRRDLMALVGPKGSETLRLLPPFLLSISGEQPSATETGVDLAGGAALFIRKDGEFIAYLPVTNRDVFRRLWGGELRNDFDSFGDGLVCGKRSSGYACSNDATTLVTLSEKPAGLARPSLHGQIEGWLGVEFAPAFPAPILTEPGALEAAITFRRGGLTLNWLANGTPHESTIIDSPSPLADEARKRHARGVVLLRLCARHGHCLAGASPALRRPS